jgi:hypothetical protein
VAKPNTDTELTRESSSSPDQLMIAPVTDTRRLIGSLDSAKLRAAGDVSRRRRRSDQQRDIDGVDLVTSGVAVPPKRPLKHPSRRTALAHASNLPAPRGSEPAPTTLYVTAQGYDPGIDLGSCRTRR